MRVRLATHRKSVYESSHFLTCVDLRLRLARALGLSQVTCAQKKGYRLGKSIKLWKMSAEAVWHCVIQQKSTPTAKTKNPKQQR